MTRTHAHPARHGQHCAGRCIARAYAAAVGLVLLMLAIGAAFGSTPAPLIHDTPAVRLVVSRPAYSGRFSPTVALDASQIIDRRSPAIID